MYSLPQSYNQTSKCKRCISSNAYDYHGMRCPYMRGMLGQYIIAIPDWDAIVVRLGRKRCDVYNREITTDITRYMDIAMKILKGK